MPGLHSNVLKNSVLWKYRDTCDRKKAKTPVVCAYVRARGRVITGIFTNEILGIRLCFLLWDFSTPQVFIKMTRRLWRNDLSFSKSDPLFFEKWLVVFWKMSRRFRRNNTSKKNGGVAKSIFAASPLGVWRRNKSKASSETGRTLVKLSFEITQ